MFRLRWGSSGPAVERPMTCAACGEGFACELSLGGCWCKEVPLSDEAREALRARYTDCLCPECLRKAGARGSPPDPTAAA